MFDRNEPVEADGRSESPRNPADGAVTPRQYRAPQLVAVGKTVNLLQGLLINASHRDFSNAWYYEGLPM